MSKKQQRETSEKPFEKNKKTSPIVGNFMATPPVFSGENYQIWYVKMKSYLEASGLWDVVMSESNRYKKIQL